MLTEQAHATTLSGSRAESRYGAKISPLFFENTWKYIVCNLSSIFL